MVSQFGFDYKIKLAERQMVMFVTVSKSNVKQLESLWQTVTVKFWYCVRQRSISHWPLFVFVEQVRKETR